MRNFIVKIKSDKYGRRWKVREGESLSHVVNAICHAMATGSVGHRDAETCYTWEGNRMTSIILADVIQVNSDNTERKPYTTDY